jgi:hypothetical protein
LWSKARRVVERPLKARRVMERPLKARRVVELWRDRSKRGELWRGRSKRGELWSCGEIAESEESCGEAAQTRRAVERPPSEPSARQRDCTFLSSNVAVFSRKRHLCHGSSSVLSLTWLQLSRNCQKFVFGI